LVAVLPVEILQLAQQAVYILLAEHPLLLLQVEVQVAVLIKLVIHLMDTQEVLLEEREMQAENNLELL
jgi:hypothetical protein